jgi:hypothetical protein
MFNGDYVHIDFTRFTYNVSYLYSNVSPVAVNIEGILPTQMDETTWNQIRVVNIDPVNNDDMSLYWINNTNLLLHRNVASFQSRNLSSFSIEVQPKSSYNFIAGTCNITATLSDIMTIPPGEIPLHTSFKLFNTFTKHLFRNLSINITTSGSSDSTTASANATVNNLIVGNTITVNGTNNICLGNNFAASGTNSIIIGNDIGTGSKGNNDIYESIIIGNTSFQDSIVRNVICIGRENMKGLTALSITDTTRVQTFLGKYPVLIGNNISSSMIDYNINIDNTFLKTTINKDADARHQIYLGLSDEVVGVGFSSNANLSADYSLNVAGAVTATHITATNTIIGITANDIPIPRNYLVSATGVLNNGIPIVQMSKSSVSGSTVIPDITVIGVSIGAKNNNDTIISINGNVAVWCDSKVTCGQLLMASSVRSGVATGCPTTLATNTNYTFAKSLTTWDGKANASSLTPYVTTSTIGGVVCGLIWCLCIT